MTTLRTDRVCRGRSVRAAQQSAGVFSLPNRGADWDIGGFWHGRTCFRAGRRWRRSLFRERGHECNGPAGTGGEAAR